MFEALINIRHCYEVAAVPGKTWVQAQPGVAVPGKTWDQAQPGAAVLEKTMDPAACCGEAWLFGVRKHCQHSICNYEAADDVYGG